MTGNTAPPARLFVALSKNEKMNLVLRRGPSRHVATFLWNRENDSFKLGQWFKGRIYEHRLDISPDGKHIIYLALGRGGNTWTAVSKTPYLKAIDFFSWMGTWGGGGIFIDSKIYELDGQPIREGMRISKQFKVRAKENYMASIYNERLIQDEWLSEGKNEYYKKISHQWVLRKSFGRFYTKNRSFENEYHRLENLKTKQTIDLPDWEWAEFDGKFLLWAEGGYLLKAKPHPETGFGTPTKLHDFNTYEFEEIIAPY